MGFCTLCDRQGLLPRLARTVGYDSNEQLSAGRSIWKPGPRLLLELGALCRRSRWLFCFAIDHCPLCYYWNRSPTRRRSARVSRGHKRCADGAFLAQCEVRWHPVVEAADLFFVHFQRRWAQLRRNSTAWQWRNRLSKASRSTVNIAVDLLFYYGARDGNRTHNHRITRPVLYH